ncbi:MAG: glycosyltransferase family 4 protein, partial [Flavobacterium sp.]
MSKKVVIVSSEFPPLPGGIGTHAMQLSIALTKKRWEVRVITNQRDSTTSEQIFDSNLSFNVTRVKRRKIVLFTYFERILKSVKIVLNCHPDVVLLSGQFSLWMIFILKIVFSKAKYIAVIHGSELYSGGKFKQWLTKRSLKKLESIITVSYFTANLLKKATGIEKVEIINNGFYPSDISVSNRNTFIKAPVLITVGNLSERKGQLNVIKVLPELLKSYPNLKYHMLGIPTIQNKIMNLATSLGVQNNIEIFGKVNEEEKMRLLSEATVFIMLSENLKDGDVEGFGIAAIEAQSNGLPVIGATESGINDA